MAATLNGTQCVPTPSCVVTAGLCPAVRRPSILVLCQNHHTAGGLPLPTSLCCKSERGAVGEMFSSLPPPPKYVTRSCYWREYVCQTLYCSPSLIHCTVVIALTRIKTVQYSQRTCSAPFCVFCYYSLSLSLFPFSSVMPTLIGRILQAGPHVYVTKFRFPL